MKNIVKYWKDIPSPPPPKKIYFLCLSLSPVWGSNDLYFAHISLLFFKKKKKKEDPICLILNHSSPDSSESSEENFMSSVMYLFFFFNVFTFLWKHSRTMVFILFKNRINNILPRNINGAYFRHFLVWKFLFTST